MSKNVAPAPLGGRVSGLRVIPAILVLTLGGCTELKPYFNPYIDAKRTLCKGENESNNCKSLTAFPQLRDAAESTEELRQNTIEHRNGLAWGKSITSYLTFGAAAAAGVAALYDAHRDLILGLGLGATGAYSFGTLFIGGDKISIYSAAGSALGCVVDSADSAVATGESLETQTKDKSRYAELQTKLAELVYDPDIKWDSDEESKGLYANGLTALAEYEAALTNIGTFKAQDSRFATAIDRTAALILEEMNKRIEQVQPNLESVLRSAEGIGGQGVALAKRVTPEKKPEAKKEGEEAIEKAQDLMAAEAPQPPDATQRANIANRAIQVKAAAKKLNETVTAEINQISAVATRCALDIPAVAPLTTTKTVVDIEKEKQVVVEFTGGKLPLTADWTGTVPGDDQFQDLLTRGHDVIVTAKASLSEGKTYHLLVRDSLAAPGEVEITVNTPKASFSADPTEVTLKKKDDTKTVTLSGGKAAYTAAWVQEVGKPNPDDKIKVDISGDKLTLTAKKDFAASDAYKLAVTDSSDPKKSVTITIKSGA